MAQQSTSEYQAAARLRNLAGWCSLGLGLLGFFFGITNNYSDGAVRITGGAIGYAVCVTFCSMTLAFHWDIFRGARSVLVSAVLVADFVPMTFWFLTFFASREYLVAQNKQ